MKKIVGYVLEIKNYSGTVGYFRELSSTSKGDNVLVTNRVKEAGWAEDKASAKKLQEWIKPMLQTGQSVWVKTVQV